MSFQWEPKPFDFGTFDRWLFVVIAVISIVITVFALPDTVDRSEQVVLDSQEMRGAVQ